ncbi:hypothetical protein F7734_49300 [Scytonema sp. UIC 10036]|uniref:hypothetical protein n=1 Tax=Scytonema sp. UIC 10036 TaxID=2304196 RepID=UPI0012DAA809|nr:hypothetical protein [Scytonema sp. UIC 10036]MUG99853.1 hypothetical protein [Scytonema sp. UIC 10036]
MAKGYNPNFERDLVEVFGEDAQKAKRLTRFIGLIKGKAPETLEEWKFVLAAWDGDRP